MGTEEIRQDTWITVARVSLIFCGICYLASVALGPLWVINLYKHSHMDESTRTTFTIIFSVMFLLIGGGIGALNFATAWGLSQGKRWAWIAGVVLGGLYTPSACMPFGLLILYGLLREQARRQYAS